MLEQAIKNILSIDKTIFFNILIPPFNLYFNYINQLLRFSKKILKILK